MILEDELQSLWRSWNCEAENTVRMARIIPQSNHARAILKASAISKKECARALARILEAEMPGTDPEEGMPGDTDTEEGNL